MHSIGETSCPHNLYNTEGTMTMNGCGQKENDGRQYSPFNMSQQADTKHCYLSYTSAHTNSLTTEWNMRTSWSSVLEVQV